MRRTLALLLILSGSAAVGPGLAPHTHEARPDPSGRSVRADFNGDGFADLVVGAFKEDVGSVTDGGAVNVLYGSGLGLQAELPDDQFWTQDSPGVQDQAEKSDAFGRSLAAGDWNGDGFADLAIGAFLEDLVAAKDAGAVNVLYGSAGGLQADAPDDQFWTQDSPGVQDQAETGDWFGWSLAGADLNGDGFADLAIGSRLEDVGDASDAGAVNVLYGSTAGLQSDAPDDQFWTQDSPDVQDQAERGDEFGWYVSGGDLNGDGFGDLAVGVHTEDLGTVSNAGAVSVLYGSAAGLQAASPDDQFWTQDSPGVKDRSERGDEFGRTEVVGDFNADGYGDLAVRVLGEDIPGVTDAGAVSVLYGSAAGLQADSPDDQLWSQDSPGVADQAETNDSFAHALGAGDFNGDGFEDLAAGSPSEDLVAGQTNARNAGAINVLYGSPAGLQADAPDDQFWTQDSPSVKDVVEPSDRLGHALATADFNGDGYLDLAIGVPFESVRALANSGLVNVLYGGPGGLQADDPDDQLWTQDSAGVQDRAEAGDQFGRSIGSSG
jgi:hypothetical protein